MPDPFAELMRHYRLQRNLTFRDLEELVGMSATNLSRIERGIVGPPPARVLQKIADALKVPVSHLLDAASVSDDEGHVTTASLENAIITNSELSEDQRQFMLAALKLCLGVPDTTSEDTQTDAEPVTARRARREARAAQVRERKSAS